jgi:predicted Fe-Mo cluster-binding NifX family protein
MKVAVPIWQDRVSPVFDVASELLVSEVSGGSVASQTSHPLPQREPVVRVRLLVDWGIDVLICGAISRLLQQMLWTRGIQVIPRKCGFVQSVLKAYLVGRLQESTYAMPGCDDNVRVDMHDSGDMAEADVASQNELSACDHITIQHQHCSDSESANAQCRWTALRENEEVGFLVLQHDRTAGKIARFEIDPAWDRTPIPCQLLQRALDYCRQHGLLKITSDRALRRPGATALFNCMGFLPSRRRSRDSAATDFYLNLYREVDPSRCLNLAPPRRSSGQERRSVADDA